MSNKTRLQTAENWQSRLKDYFSGDELRLPGFWRTTAGIFLVLTLFHLSYLNEPPFWDEIFGLHNQAIWLARHHFRFWELMVPQEAYKAGGSWCYPTSFMPFVMGVFYACFPPWAAHTLCRLLSLFSAAVTISAFLEICRSLKIQAQLAWFMAVLFTSFPLFAGQAVSAGQETEIAALMMVSLLYFVRNRFPAAFAFAFAACLIKATAVPIVGAYAVWYGIQSILSRGKNYKAETLFSIAGLAFFPILIRLLAHGTNFNANLSLSEVGTLIQLHYTLFFRDFFLFCLMTGMAAGFAALRKTKVPSPKIDSRILAFLLTSGGFFAAYFLQNAQPHCARYAVIAFFPAAVVATVLLNRMQSHFRYWFLGLFLTVNILNQNGLLMPEIPLLAAANGSYYERSKEYFSVIRAQKEMLHAIEAENGKAQYICTWPYPQIMTVTEFGYVTRKIEGVLTGKIFPRYANALPLSAYDPVKPVHFIQDFPVHPPFFPLPPAQDAVNCLKIIPIPGSSNGGVVLYDVRGTAETLKRMNAGPGQ